MATNLHIDDEELQSFFNESILLVSDIENRGDEHDLLVLKERTDIAINSFCALTQDFPHCQDKFDKMLCNFRIFSDILRREILDLDPFIATYRTQPPTSITRGRGRPKIHIEEETLVYFRDLGFSWTEISQVLMVSRWTVQRRVDELGLRGVLGYSTISDEELDNIVRTFKDTHGLASGRSMVLGHLKSIGLRVQQKRVVKSLVRVDPDSSRARWAILIKRRKYNVPGPNSLWHIDGNHSLVNWGFVIHGGIDGYSRMITFLNCSCNNRKETVASLFDNAISNHGLPSRIRTDKGGENVMIWQRMEELRGENRGSYIAGSSVHNQRIERLWRDVWNHVTCNFYYVFQALEEEGVLNRCNEFHMFILHYVFLPRINHVIQSFTSGWNNHPLRTMKNWSPEKIWANGMLDKRNTYLPQVAEMHDDDVILNELEFYGVDWYGPSPTDDDLSLVDVSEIECPLDENQYQELLRINSLAESNDYGIDIYMNALNILNDV